MRFSFPLCNFVSFVVSKRQLEVSGKDARSKSTKH